MLNPTKSLSVHTSNDYTMFRKLEGNREVKSRAKGIKKSIEKIGWMMQPILVNENMEIIEGQARFHALKELGLPIYYIIQAGVGLTECRYLNLYNQTWKIEDIIRSKAAEENDGCRKLCALIDEFHVTANEAYCALLDTQKVGRDDFEKDIRISDEQYMKGRQHLIAYTQLRDILKPFHGAKRNYVWAVSYCVDHGVDINKMAKALKKIDIESFNSSSRESILKSMQDAYNFNTKKKEYRIHIYESYRMGE